MRQKSPPPNDSIPAISSLCASGSRDSPIASIASQISAAPTGILTRNAQRQPRRRGDQPAHERADGDGDADERAPEAERLGPFRALEFVPEHGERRAELDRRAHALQGSRSIQNDADGARPHRSDAKVKIARPTISMRRRP